VVVDEQTWDRTEWMRPKAMQDGTIKTSLSRRLKNTHRDRSPGSCHRTGP